MGRGERERGKDRETEKETERGRDRMGVNLAQTENKAKRGKRNNLILKFVNEVCVRD